MSSAPYLQSRLQRDVVPECTCGEAKLLRPPEVDRGPLHAEDCPRYRWTGTQVGREDSSR